VRVQRVGWRSGGRVEDYADLRSWGLTREQAAVRLGVTMRTVLRYDAALREAVRADCEPEPEEAA
jgi:hypothetical protein